jgi:dienelactone hydrolase
MDRPVLRFAQTTALALLLATASTAHAQAPADPRRADLALLQERLIPSRPPATGRMGHGDTIWDDWVRRTGELPPDFNALPSIPELPDPLQLRSEGRTVPITTPAQWEQQRRWIRSQIEHWVFGRMPPAPDNLRVASATERVEGDVRVRDVLLEFGPGHRARLHLQLFLPRGNGPFPVFLTNHSRERSSWLHTAVSRGYIGCYYQATDPTYGLPDDSDGFIDVYPEYDFSCLARWAWAAARAVDYLFTLPEVEKRQIGIAGHSRNGKQALLATAFDERIGAVVASSGLQGEVLPHRYTADPFVVESIQLITGAQPHWYHPRLRFFTGREHKLPVDQNMLMALVAPRGLMFYSGYSEVNSSVFGSEQAYRDVRRVYRFLGREENIWLHLRPGPHATTTSDVENFMDFFDTVFGRRQLPKSETWINGYDFDEWKATTGVRVDPRQFPARTPGDFFRTPDGRALADANAWEQRKAELRTRLQWALGDAPPQLAVAPAESNAPGAGGSLPPRPVRTLRENAPPPRNPIELVLGRPQGDKLWQERLAAAGMGVSALPFGPGLQADVFYPVDAAGKRQPGRKPVVLWLHAYAHDGGWSAKEPWSPRLRDFVMDQRPSFDALVRRGFIVVAFDQIGFGGRLHDARRFYQRYPQWSLLGKMVADTRSVLDALAGLDEADPNRIFALGYALGAKVGLLTAALDERLKGVVAVCGVQPLRLDGRAKGAEGLRHYSHLHGLLPKLGFFLGEEARAPFDYDEVLALAAPRPILVVAPELDRFAPLEDVRVEVSEARKAYRLLGREAALELRTPRDFNRFAAKLQAEVVEYLAQAAR